LLLHQQEQVDHNQWSDWKNNKFKLLLARNNFEKLIYYLLIAVAFLNCLGEQHAGATILVNGIVALVNHQPSISCKN